MLDGLIEQGKASGDWRDAPRHLDVVFLGGNCTVQPGDSTKRLDGPRDKKGEVPGPGDWGGRPKGEWREAQRHIYVFS